MTPFLEESYPALLTDTATSISCPSNCSLHGECHKGVCVCQIFYKGKCCSELNTIYLVSFGALFSTLGCVAFVQLVLCMKSDYDRGNKSSIRTALEITTQKLLYLLTICAAAIRGAYFLSQWTTSPVIASNLMSAYYPFLITGFSLLICFWAEAFHLHYNGTEKPRFLSKSFLAFTSFNIVLYILLMSELVITLCSKGESSAYTTQVFNGVFASFMFINAVLFLAYGVEVYFKVRGAFRQSFQNLNWMQLHMSRLGLVMQGSLQLITTVCLASYVIQGIWSDSLPVLNLNLYVIGFHIAEFGLILWFPCVLWNYKRPDELWVLNPRRIFLELETPNRPIFRERYLEDEAPTCFKGYECWICYEGEKRDLGQFIQPCLCKGDVSAVHHDCLRKWLLESQEGSIPPSCKVCGQKYILKKGVTSLTRGFTSRHWCQTLLGVFVFSVCPPSAYIAYRFLLNTPTRFLVIGISIIVQLACLKLLASTVKEAYRRAKLIGVKIDGRSPESVYCVATNNDVLFASY